MSQYQLNNEELAERLLLTRRRAGLSQNEFAARVGVSPRAYRNYELAIREAPLNLVMGIHCEFGTSFDWLILGDGEPIADGTDLANALAKAKAYAHRYLKKSDREFDDAAIIKLEAVFLKSILQDAKSLETELKLMETLDEI